jgi:hypothetical protein
MAKTAGTDRDSKALQRGMKLWRRRIVVDSWAGER